MPDYKQHDGKVVVLEHDGVVAPVVEVLAGALNADLTEVALIGRRADGKLYVAGSHHSAKVMALFREATKEVNRITRAKE